MVHPTDQNQHDLFSLLSSFYSYWVLASSSSVLSLPVSYPLLLLQVQMHFSYLCKKALYPMDVKIPPNPVLASWIRLSLVQEE